MPETIVAECFMQRPANDNGTPVPDTIAIITGGVRDVLKTAAVEQRGSIINARGCRRLEAVYCAYNDKNQRRILTYEQAARGLLSIHNSSAGDIFRPVAEFLLSVGNIMVTNYMRFLNDKKVYEVIDRLKRGISVKELVRIIESFYPNKKQAPGPHLRIVK